jgi:acetone carboxylase gamma subunit
LVQIECDCNERYGIEINTYKLFEELKEFFETKVNMGVFSNVTVTETFYTGKSDINEIKWYSTKWYKCNFCGCLWEFDYPDFPAKGFIKKFDNGRHVMEEK